jgi:glycerophosphoryl diester phosphodiesterase
MNRTARILALIFVCILSLTACTAKSGGDAVKAEAPYEPDTSLALPATVAYAVKGAAAFQTGERPNSAFVMLDEDLNVLDTEGSPAAKSLDAFFEGLSGVIPGLYVKTDSQARLLAAYLKKIKRQDVIVAAEAGSGALIKSIKAELPAVRGLLDFSETRREMTREELGQMAAKTNASGAKIVLLAYETATRETVRYLQSRLITVWARPEGGVKELLMLITNGISGLMTGDYHAAYDVMSLFKADAPILLRTPLIIGHRGLAGSYTENTLRSEQAAKSAGADMLEYDIYISSDGELFVLHDETLERLFDRPDVKDVEALTLAELQAIPFDNDSKNGVQKRNHTPAKDSPNGVISLESADRIPSLREIFEAFRDTDVIHMVEIKSQNPAIAGKLKALAQEYGVVDQMNVISFNVPILKAMAEEWPEMSLGCLGYDDAKGSAQRKGRLLDPEREVPYANHEKLLHDNAGDAKNALLALNEVLGPYNGTYNPSYAGISYGMLKAGRHLGITAWPWTYNSPDMFAKDYLFGMWGLTTNFSAWASGLPESITLKDSKMAMGETHKAEEAFTAVLTDYQGGAYHTENIEPVIVSGAEYIKLEGDTLTAVSQGTSLMLLRARVPLVISGKDYGAYYVYSNPVTLTVETN